MLLSLLDTLFNQHARLLELKTALPDATLLVERFTGHEAISESFRFEIDCVSTNAHINLNNLLGEEVTLQLLLADGGKRSWHGYVNPIHAIGRRWRSGPLPADHGAFFGLPCPTAGLLPFSGQDGCRHRWPSTRRLPRGTLD